MALFLILSPFAVLSALLATAPAMVALFVAALTATALICADLVRGRSPKLLQIGAALVLGAVGCYVLFIDRQFSGIAARTVVDAGVLAIALLSLALRFPFTIQYARETVDDETAARPEFHSVNYVLTWVWTAALVIMLVADLGTIYAPWLPLWTGLAAAFAARNAAAYFTRWYTGQRRAKVTAERASPIPPKSSVDGEIA